MTGKRKRNRHCQSAEDRPGKRVRGGRAKNSGSAISLDTIAIKHPVLSLYYPCVVPLRKYLLSKLPVSSKARRRRLLATGSCPEQCRPAGRRKDHAVKVGETLDGPNDYCRTLACLLDTTLVCGPDKPCSAPDQSRMNDLVTFSQQQSKSTAGSSPGTGSCSQSEVCLIHFLNVDILSNVAWRPCRLQVYDPPYNVFCVLRSMVLGPTDLVISSLTLSFGNYLQKGTEAYISLCICCAMGISALQCHDGHISTCAPRPSCLEWSLITQTTMSTLSRAPFGRACLVCWEKKRSDSCWI